MKENEEVKYYEKVMDSTLIVQEYIFYSEMEGELDYDDPWMALYNGLSELRGKLADEKEFSEMIDNPICESIPISDTGIRLDGEKGLTEAS